MSAVTENMTQQLIAYIKKAGSARADDMDEKFSLERGRACGLLYPFVKDGTLVMCKVDVAGRRVRPTNEYRLSVAGGAAPRADFTPMKTPRPAAQRGADAQRRLPADGPPKADPQPSSDPRIGEIEKGVPIPSRQNGGVLRAAFASMDIGDSRVVSHSKQAIYYAASKLKIKVAVRREGEQGDRRVWRTR